MRFLLLATMCLVMAACSRDTSDPVADFSAREMTMPTGAKIRVETMVDPMDITRGMMFRESLAPDRGMLFIYGSSGQHSFWTYQVKIPLDIVWMDQQRRVVEISANTPPCPSKSARTCPHYGGREPSLFVLELGAGLAAKYGVQVGSVIDF